MSFQNDTNHKRVQKILEILDLVHKSALSNDADEDEIMKMLKPLLDRIGIPSGAPSQPAQEPVKQSKHTWADVTNMARKAPLSSVCDAMAIFLSRIDDEIFNKNN